MIAIRYIRQQMFFEPVARSLIGRQDFSRDKVALIYQLRAERLFSHSARGRARILSARLPLSA